MSASRYVENIRKAHIPSYEEHKPKHDLCIPGVLPIYHLRVVLEPIFNDRGMGKWPISGG